MLAMIRLCVPTRCKACRLRAHPTPLQPHKMSSLRILFVAYCTYATGSYWQINDFWHRLRLGSCFERLGGMIFMIWPNIGLREMVREGYVSTHGTFMQLCLCTSHYPG